MYFRSVSVVRKVRKAIKFDEKRNICKIKEKVSNLGIMRIRIFGCNVYADTICYDE